MSIHPLPNTGQGPNLDQMRAAVESKLREIQSASNDLLRQTEDADAGTAELLRTEITRLADCGFVLTRLLCFDDVQRAYEIVCGGADEDGSVLGVAV